MTPARYARVRELFVAARSTARERRAAFLDEACGADDEVRREVESLLASAERSGGFLQTPALRGMLSGENAGWVARPLPERIGEYRIVGVLGEGGMGIVYRAEQEHPRRSVALKVIRPGCQSPETLKRFEHESEVLGWLQHPGIAQVYAAGTAEMPGGGQPYFAMELIAGQPLAAYVAARHLSLRERLELMARICDAVHHAHQKGVIHRDLKPGNILVVENTGPATELGGGPAGGQPKILDFGVARATDADLRTTTLQTGVGHLVGTMAYMSPEQVAGEPRELDTRSDIYALGVILYELLTGALPVDVTQKSIPEAARAIAEQEPVAPGVLQRKLRGDLDAVVLKALEKDKRRRYASASDLAADLRRYLADQPVSARPITTLYQLRKFARRNRPLVAGVLAAAAALLVGIVGTSWGLVQATAQRRTAEAQRNRAVEAEALAEQRRAEAEGQRDAAERYAAAAQAVNDFLNNDLLAAARPERQGREVTVREVVDQAAQALDGRFPDQPLTEAAVRTTLGDTYDTLGEGELAVAQLEQAVVLFGATLGEEEPRTLHALSRLGLAYLDLAQLAEAETLLAKTLELRRRVLGERESRTLASMNHLALVYERQGRWDEEEALLARVIEIACATAGDEDYSLCTALTNLGNLQMRRGRLAEAESLLVPALDLNRRLSGPEHPATLTAMHDLVKLYAEQARFAEAEPLCVQTLAIRRRVLGAEHPKTLATMNTLAVLYKKQGKLDLAEPLYEETLATKRRVLGDEHQDTLVSMNNLASLYAVSGRLAEAEALYLRTLGLRRRQLGDAHPQTHSTLQNLVELYELMGQPERAAEFRARRPATRPTARAGTEH